MSDSAGFNVEDLMGTTRDIGEEMERLAFEEMTNIARRQQQAQKAKEDKVLDLELDMELLQKQLEKLQAKAYQLEGIHNEKEELFKKLRFQCNEAQQDLDRQLEQTKKHEELLDEYTCKIQEIKLKHRKLRMKFENELLILTEQHKSLAAVFSLERLPAEIERTENSKRQLLLVEQTKLAQLHSLQEKLEEVKKQKQLGTASAESEDEQKAAL